ncbi:hypothetical protein CJ030_MR4G004166 [Morella rubra]|uniref:Uncharacterized protein n=1 Tax=Morella rubra TaxID=262757 RepID=A0A6A1VTH1_9ROSI|nr:hypothetical protein CJ030_MR4G004166 [Morella rubra]
MAKPAEKEFFRMKEKKLCRRNITPYQSATPSPGRPFLSGRLRGGSRLPRVALFRRDELRRSQLKVAKALQSWSLSQSTLAREALKQLGFCS